MEPFLKPAPMYQVGGSLPPDASTYVVRQADALLLTALQRGDLCYIFNARQMGKSSLRVRVSQQLAQQGLRCATVDMTALGVDAVTPEQWYAAIAAFLVQELGLSLDLPTWWRAHAHLTLVRRLGTFLETVVLAQSSTPVVIFLDEIDSVLSLPFSTSDLFALLRSFYTPRSRPPDRARLRFALLGVTTPSQLIADKTRTPFNLGTAIPLTGFTAAEAAPLLPGLAQVTDTPAIALREILTWTGGQPFLTQKLCALVVQQLPTTMADALPTAIQQLVETHILTHWEVQDEPEHLRTIRDRLLRQHTIAARSLGLYQQILQAERVPRDASDTQLELCLSGLVVNRLGHLEPANPIYARVFDAAWVATQLDNLRPYAAALNAWVASEQQDNSRLLLGQALQEAQQWAAGKRLSDVDYQFLAASQRRDRAEVQQALEAARLAEVERRLAQERRHSRRQKWWLMIVSVLLVVACALGLFTFTQYRTTRLSELQAITVSAEALLASEQRLDSLLEALRAQARQTQFQRLGNVTPELAQRVRAIAQRAVFTATEFNRLTAHAQAVYSVAFSPDGQTLATVSEDQTLKLWQRNGQLLHSLDNLAHKPLRVAFSPDGRQVATAGNVKTIQLWQPDGTLQRTVPAHDDAIWGLAYSADGQLLGSASWDKTAKLWSAATGELWQTLPHEYPVTAIAISPDGQVIATGDRGKQIHLWNRAGEKLQTLTGHAFVIYDLAFSPDGQQLASASWDNTVKLWQVQDGTLRHTLEGHKSGVWSVTFSPNGQLLASTSHDRTIRLWHAIDGHPLATLAGHGDAVFDAAFSPDSATLASTSGDATVRFWQLIALGPSRLFAAAPSSPPLVQILDRRDWQISSLTFSPEGQTLAATGESGVTRLWGLDGQLQGTLRGHSAWRVSFSPDGKWIASNSISQPPGVALWNRQGDLTQRLNDHEGAVWDVAFSPDGEFLASVGSDQTVRLWDSTGRSRQVLQGHTNWVHSVVWHPDSTRLASGSTDTTVRIWNRQGQSLHVLQGHNGRITSVAASPDGQVLASASADATVRLWDWAGTLQHVLQGHQQGVNDLAFHPQQPLLASASGDGTIKLWRFDGTLLTTLAYDDAGVMTIAFSPDGRYLVSGTDSGLILVWDVARVTDFPTVLATGCTLVQDYLTIPPSASPSVRDFCQSQPPP